MSDRAVPRKWLYVVAAAIALGAAGTYQFVWSSIRPALSAQTGASEAALGTVFTVYVVAQTLSQFPAGWVRDRYGPRVPLAVGAALLAVGFVGTGRAVATWQATVWYALGGVGAGAVYSVAVNTPVKWFTERRGLATGLVTMAYGGLSVLFIPFVRDRVGANFQSTLLVLGAVAGGGVVLGAALLRDPERRASDGAGEAGVEPALTDPDAEAAVGWRGAVRTWQFWVLYALYVVVNAVGLMLIGKAVGFARQFGLAGGVVTAAASVVAFSDSAGIVTVGWLSDRLGRERTLAVTVVLSGVAMALAVWAGSTGHGIVFALVLGGAVFFRSPVFSITPALVGEYYGPARSSENYAVLYTSKVWGGVGGGVAASLLIASLGWSTTFLLGAAALGGVGLLAFGLRPVE